MNKLVILTIALALLAFPALANVEAGAKAPDFMLQSVDGETVNLSDYAGKTVVLEWTNHECPYVKKHYESGNMQSLQKEATAEDIVWLTIVSSAPGRQGYTEAEEAKALIQQVGAAATSRLFDPTGETGKLYGAMTTPHMYVINPEGNLVYQGAIDDNTSANPATIEGARNYVRDALAAVKEGRAMDPAVTKPYGCGIKYKI